MSIRDIVNQTRSVKKLDLKNKKQFTEAFNVPIQKDSDVDDFDTKLDKTQLKSLLKYFTKDNLNYFKSKSNN